LTCGNKSIEQGTVSASLMLRKLGAYPRQNGLAMALRELGRIERTLFTLEWLQSTELRRRVQSGLNKGEAKNALARAVFFNRLGEMRGRSFENQRYRASGLTLGSGRVHSLEYGLFKPRDSGPESTRFVGRRQPAPTPITPRLGTRQPHRGLRLAAEPAGGGRPRLLACTDL
jgi:hypothetical protein